VTEVPRTTPGEPAMTVADVLGDRIPSPLLLAQEHSIQTLYDLLAQQENAVLDARHAVAIAESSLLRVQAERNLIAEAIKLARDQGIE
jgi:hypothetical protein